MRILREKKFSKTRYIKQTTRFNCGPTALYNAMLWKRCNYIYGIRKLERFCNCKLPFGTTFKDMNLAIRKIVNSSNLELKAVKKNVTLKDIKDHNGIILLNFHWETSNDSGEHYVIIEPMNFGGYVINDDEGADESVITKFYTDRMLKTLLIKYNFKDKDEFKGYDEQDREYPKAWFFH
jgi:hypothetical protein